MTVPEPALQFSAATTGAKENERDALEALGVTTDCMACSSSEFCNTAPDTLPCHGWEAGTGLPAWTPSSSHLDDTSSQAVESDGSEPAAPTLYVHCTSAKPRDASAAGMWATVGPPAGEWSPPGKSSSRPNAGDRAPASIERRSSLSGCSVESGMVMLPSTSCSIDEDGAAPCRMMGQPAAVMVTVRDALDHMTEDPNCAHGTGASRTVGESHKPELLRENTTTEGVAELDPLVGAPTMSALLPPSSMAAMDHPNHWPAPGVGCTRI